MIHFNKRHKSTTQEYFKELQESEDIKINNQPSRFDGGECDRIFDGKFNLQQYLLSNNPNLVKKFHVPPVVAVLIDTTIEIDTLIPYTSAFAPSAVISAYKHSVDTTH
jgi:predicted 3-demethylubiquinone-9 3-methyltransferase (glyoxalase superfamily)